MGASGMARPRRAAAAQVDLSLALLAVGKPDEAAGVALRPSSRAGGLRCRHD
jgi:hypothetical protein